MLTNYIFSGDPECFKSTYTCYNRRCGLCLESITPLSVLKHMRNVVSHKKITLFPVQTNGGGELSQVTHIVFEDYLESNPEKYFRLMIRRDDFESVMLEISNYFINIDYIRVRDSRR